MKYRSASPTSSSFVVGAVLASVVAATATASTRAASEDRKPHSSPVPRALALRAPDPGDDHVHFDEVDGVVWARGATYKASFGAEGASYVPFFGARAPRNFPLALSPASVTRGGEALEFERRAPAARRDQRVELDRGAFVEVYELAPDVVEQLFVFDALAGDGDLVLSLPGQAELASRESTEGLVFENEHGRVRYGRAVAIDAAGRRFDAPTAFVDGAISIRVDDAFLDGATFPLTIDPLITTVAVDVTISNHLEADVVFDDASSRWLVVYEQVFSDSDHDVFSKALSADGASVLASGYVDLTASDWRAPRCANNKLAGTWLVVGQRNGSVVMGRIVTAATHAMAGQFTIAVDAVSPDVGGDPYDFAFPGSAYCVVYARMVSDIDWDIMARGIGGNGGLGLLIPLSVNSAAFERTPSISKSNGEVEWMITWLRDSPSGTSSVYGARIDWDGNVTQTPTYLSGPGALAFPEVSSAMYVASTGALRYLVAWQQRMSPGDHDVRLLYVENGIALSLANLGQLENQGAFDTSDQLYPSVECDGDHFAVAYCDEFGTSGTDYDVYVDDVYVSGTTIGLAQNRTTLAFSASAELFPRIASRHGAGVTDAAAARRHFIVWDDHPTPANGNIEGAIFATNPGGELQPSCLGDGTSASCPCGNDGAPGHGCAHSFSADGALLSGSGFVSTVQDTLRFDVTNLPPASSQVTIFQGTSSSAPAAFGDGLRCATGTVLRIATVPSSSGSAAYGFGVAGSEPISVRGAIPPLGATRHYQSTYRNSVGFCTAATFNVTNGLRAIWAP